MSKLLWFRWQEPLLIVVLLINIAGARAQVAGDSRSLSLADSLRRAGEQNPSLLAQGFHERAAEARTEQARLQPNPTLEVALENFAGTGSRQGIRGLESTVQANQLIERGGKRDKRVLLASRERELAAKEFAARRNEIHEATATAYVRALSAKQNLELAAEPLRLAHDTVTAVEGRVNAGAASPAEAARARASLAIAKAEFARAEAALSTARTELAVNWGGSPEDVSTLLGALRIPEVLPSCEELMTRLVRHPRLDMQQAVIAGRRAALSLEQSEAVQDFSIGGGVRFLREGSDAALVAGFSMPIPVRNRNQGNIRAARESLAGAEQGVRVVEIELRAAFTAAWQNLSAAHRAAQNLTREALPAMEEAYQTVRSAYDLGQLPLIDVLDAQRALVAIRREILDAEADYALALARIDALTDPKYGALSALISNP